MKTSVVISIHLALALLAACGQTPVIPTPSVTPTTIPTNTPRPTFTPTPTITPTPTPIGGTEPKIAFVGKDSQGNLGIYIDGLYTGRPQKIASVALPEEEAAILQMRWSPTGTYLIVENGNEFDGRSFFLFESNSLPREITRIPNGKYVFDLDWSPDRNLYFGQASRRARTIFVDEVYHKLDLSNGEISRTKEYFPSNHSSHVNSFVNCNQSTFPEAVRALLQHGDPPPYDRICFYPELNTYAGLKYNEQTTEFVFFTEKGEVGKTLVTYPANFGLNGSMDLKVSPDLSQVLLIGEGSLQSFGNGCCGIAYAVELSGSPLDKTDLNSFKGWPHIIHVFGWSPDSMNYLIAERNWNAPNPHDLFEIVHATSGEVVYKYRIHTQVFPVFSISQGISGYDMVWPGLP